MQTFVKAHWAYIQFVPWDLAVCPPSTGRYVVVNHLLTPSIVHVSFVALSERCFCVWACRVGLCRQYLWLVCSRIYQSSLYSRVDWEFMRRVRLPPRTRKSVLDVGHTFDIPNREIGVEIGGPLKRLTKRCNEMNIPFSNGISVRRSRVPVFERWCWSFHHNWVCCVGSDSITHSYHWTREYSNARLIFSNTLIVGKPYIQ